MRKILTFLVIAFFAIAPLAKPGFASEQVAREAYRLAAGDRLRISVFEQQAVSGDARVAIDGAITLPLLGRVPAAGLTLEQLGQNIAHRLVADHNYLDPSVTVEVVEYRPIYVGGFVRSPGRYVYEPGMTAAAAVYAAGGYGRPGGALDATTTVQSLIVNTERDLEALSVDRLRLLARIARLHAEISGAQTIEFPEELFGKSSESAKPFVDAESRLFKDGLQSRASLTSATTRHIKLVNEEIAQLEKQEADVLASIGYYRTELDDAKSLRAKGFERKVRILDLQRRISELSADRHQIAADTLRATQDIGNLERDRIERQANYREKVEEDLVSSEKQIAKVEASLKAARALTEIYGGGAIEANQLGEGQFKYILTVGRKTGDKSEDSPVFEDATLQPGDILTVAKVPM